MWQGDALTNGISAPYKGGTRESIALKARPSPDIASTLILDFPASAPQASDTYTL